MTSPVTRRASARARWTWIAGLALILAAFALWESGMLGRAAWDFDEGANLLKARMVLDGRALYREVWSDQPPLFTYALAGALRLWGADIVVGRALALGFALLWLAGVACLAAQLSGRWAGLVAAALMALSPHVQRLAVTCLIGMPALCLATWALVAAVAADRARSRGAAIRWLIGSGVLMAASLGVKPVAAPVYLALAWLAWWAPDQRSALRWRRLAALTLAMTLAGGALVLVSDAPAFLSQIVATFFSAREGYGFSLGYNLRELAGSLGGGMYPGLFALGLVGLAILAAARRWRQAALLALWGLGATASVLLHTPLRWHEHVLIVPPAIVAACAGVGQALCWVRARRGTACGAPTGLFDMTLSSAGEGGRSAARVRAALVIATSLALLGMVAGLPATLRADTQALSDALWLAPDQAARDGAAFLLANTRAGEAVFADDPLLLFQTRRATAPELTVPSRRRILSGGLTSQAMIALTERDRPAVVMLWRNRFTDLADYAAWLGTHYRPVRAYPDRARAIYVPLERERALAAPSGRDGMLWEPVYAPPEVQHAQAAMFGEAMALVGYDLASAAPQAGGELALRLHWKALQPMEADYTVFVHLLDAQGAIAAQRDQPPGAGAFPTAGWQSGEFLPDEYHLNLPADLSAGVYRLALGVYDPATGARLSAASGDQPVPDDRLLLDMPVQVRR